MNEHTHTKQTKKQTNNNKNKQNRCYNILLLWNTYENHFAVRKWETFWTIL